MTRKLLLPFRIWHIFILLLSFFLLIKRREKFLWLKPLSPKELKSQIVKLGASFIKLAQVLATRADFFPPVYLNELKTLHDELPKMDEKDFDRVYEKAFGKSKLFEKFDKNPIASASIGQVHEAYLKNGQKVAVKLRRYGIKKRVQSDISILVFLNRLFRPLFSHYTKNSIEAVIKEFSKMILQEVDFKHELQNLKKFSSIYKDCGVLFPEAYDEFCNEEAIVMSFMEGFRFDDKESLKKAGIDFHPIIETLIDFYAEQMLVKGFFHADPHPGNLLINKKGELILLDFGMVKRIPNGTRIAIIEMIKSAHDMDYDLYVSSAKKLGTIAYEAPPGEMAEFVERMFAIFNNKSLDATSMQNLAFDILNSMRDLPFKLPQEAIYILRVSAIIEGLGTTYIENFNGIKDILPILQKNIPRALGNKESIVELIWDEIKSAPFVFADLKSTLKQASDGSLKVEISPNQLAWIKKELSSYTKRYFISFGLMLGSILFALLYPEFKSAGIAIFLAGFGIILF